jgi:tRNA modification GTPase
VAISAKFKTGLAALKEAMSRLAATSDIFDDDTVYITNIRHFHVLSQASELVIRGRDNLLGGRPPEIVSIDLREALERLDEIAGRTLPEEVLNRLFSTFCIGK